MSEEHTFDRSRVGAFSSNGEKAWVIVNGGDVEEYSIAETGVATYIKTIPNPSPKSKTMTEYIYVVEEENPPALLESLLSHGGDISKDGKWVSVRMGVSTRIYTLRTKFDLSTGRYIRTRIPAVQT